MTTMKQVSVGGRHIQYILENVLRQTILREDKGHPLKQDDKKEYKLAEGIISTNGDSYIEIRFYQDYRLTVTDNLFTFPIVTRTGERHIMKVLTDKQQEEILIYCGFKRPEPKQKCFYRCEDNMADDVSDDELPPHCHKCFNMNINMLVLPYVERAFCYNCLPAEEEYDCCECCNKPFNHPIKRNEECCDCTYEDDGTIISFKEWCQKSADK